MIPSLCACVIIVHQCRMQVHYSVTVVQTVDYIMAHTSSDAFTRTCLVPHTSWLPCCTRGWCNCQEHGNNMFIHVHKDWCESIHVMTNVVLMWHLGLEDRHPAMTTKMSTLYISTLLYHWFDIPIVVWSLGQVLRLLGDDGLVTLESNVSVENVEEITNHSSIMLQCVIILTHTWKKTTTQSETIIEYR